MIIVHDIFICKPGNASKVAKMFKEAMGGVSGKGKKITVMTDMVGQYHKVVMVSEYADLTAYEKSFKMYMNPTPAMKKQFAKMEGMNDMYLTGSREIYKVW